MQSKSLDPKIVAGLIAALVVVIGVVFFVSTRNVNNDSPASPPPRIDGTPSTLKPNQGFAAGNASSVSPPVAAQPGLPPAGPASAPASAGTASVPGVATPPTPGAAPTSAPGAAAPPASPYAASAPQSAPLAPGQKPPVGAPLTPGSVLPDGRTVNQDGTVGPDHAPPPNLT